MTKPTDAFTKMNIETAFQVCRLILFASRKQTQQSCILQEKQNCTSVCTVEWQGLLAM